MENNRIIPATKKVGQITSFCYWLHTPVVYLHIRRPASHHLRTCISPSKDMHQSIRTWIKLSKDLHQAIWACMILLFDFYSSRSVSFSSDIQSGPKISVLGLALSLSVTCIILSRDLYYHFLGPALLLPGPLFLLPYLLFHFQMTCITSPWPLCPEK